MCNGRPCCYGKHVGPCCPGYFHDSATGEIERCDECAIFPDDIAAAEAERKARVRQSDAMVLAGRPMMRLMRLLIDGMGARGRDFRHGWSAR